MSIIKKFLAGSILALALFAFVSAVPASAQGSLLAPTCGPGTNNPCPIIGNAQIDGSREGLSGIILTIAQFAVYILGAIAVLFLVYGGFLYVTDDGSGSKAKQGGTIFRNAVVGLILAIAAFAIVNVVGTLVSGQLLPS
jgi:Type IV secretion system pilin